MSADLLVFLFAVHKPGSSGYTFKWFSWYCSFTCFLVSLYDIL